MDEKLIKFEHTVVGEDGFVQLGYVRIKERPERYNIVKLHEDKIIINNVPKMPKKVFIILCETLAGTYSRV